MVQPPPQKNGTQGRRGPISPTAVQEDAHLFNARIGEIELLHERILFAFRELWKPLEVDANSALACEHFRPDIFILAQERVTLFVHQLLPLLEKLLLLFRAERRQHGLETVRESSQCRKKKLSG